MKRPREVITKGHSFKKFYCKAEMRKGVECLRTEHEVREVGFLFLRRYTPRWLCVQIGWFSEVGELRMLEKRDNSRTEG